MSDERLRELKRRFEETRSPADEAAWLGELVRAGRLSGERLAFAAQLGHPAAVEASGAGPRAGSPLEWLAQVEDPGERLPWELTARVCHTAAELLMEVVEVYGADDSERSAAARLALRQLLDHLAHSLRSPPARVPLPKWRPLIDQLWAVELGDPMCVPECCWYTESGIALLAVTPYLQSFDGYASHQEAAEWTLRCLRNGPPPTPPGLEFVLAELRRSLIRWALDRPAPDPKDLRG